MPRTALAAYGLYVFLAFGLRTIIQLRNTGTSGFKGISGDFGSLEWLGGALFFVAFLSAPAAALLDWSEALEPVAMLDHPLAHIAGIVVYGLGLAGTIGAQFSMGDSWRIGVDTSERTTLVTAGPFAYVRNPIFTALLVASAGLVLMVPNVLAFLAFIAMLIAIEIQVRSVEEPYLLRAQGTDYAEYAQRVGRFVPTVGTVVSKRVHRDTNQRKTDVAT